MTNSIDGVVIAVAIGRDLNSRFPSVIRLWITGGVSRTGSAEPDLVPAVLISGVTGAGKITVGSGDLFVRSLDCATVRGRDSALLV